LVGIEVAMSADVECASVSEMAVKTLACAVIKQALCDALDPTVPERIRRDAEQFLAGDVRFRRWSAVAGVPPDGLLSRRLTA